MCFSGRTPHSINSFKNYLKNASLDVEFIALLHKIFRHDCPTHLHRGYTIVSKQGEIFSSQNYYDQVKKPFCLVFGEVDQTYINTTKELLKIPQHFSTIKRYLFTVDASVDKMTILFYRIEELLSLKGISTLDAINNEKCPNLDNILAGVATQIAVFELLKCLGTTPSYTLGFSYGEFANAYANGLCSIEQTVLTAYHFGQVLSCDLDLNHHHLKSKVRTYGFV